MVNNPNAPVGDRRKHKHRAHKQKTHDTTPPPRDDTPGPLGVADANGELSE